MEKPSFVYVTYIDSTPEKVWQAITDGEITKLYWGRQSNISDWKVGSPWQHRDCDDATKVAVEGEVLESDPPKKLVLTWTHPGSDLPASQVTFDIGMMSGIVRLTVTHAGVDPESHQGKMMATGWPIIMSSLKSMLERGTPLAPTTKRWGGSSE